jgi:hypothetical protein
MQKILKKKGLSLVSFLVISVMALLLIPAGVLVAANTTYSGIGDQNYGPGNSYSYGETILFHFDGVDITGITGATLTIYAYDVDEEYGQVDQVYLNGHFLGNLSGADEEYSTTVFTVDSSYIVSGTNNVRIDPDVNDEGWVVTVEWGQLLIKNDSAPGNTPGFISSFTVNSWDNSGNPVNLDGTLNVKANIAGTFNVEANLIDPNLNNLDLYTGSMTSTYPGEDLSLNLSLQYPKPSITGTYTINILLYDNNSPRTLLDAYYITFEHEQGVGITQVNQGQNVALGSGGVMEPVVWVRNLPFVCQKVWVNEDNDFQFLFWYPYANNNWVRIYDMAGIMVFETDLAYDNPNLIVDLPDGSYTVKTFHTTDTPIQEFIISKP